MVEALIMPLLVNATYDLLKAKVSLSIENFKNILKDTVKADVLKGNEFALTVENIKKLELKGLDKTAIEQQFNNSHIFQNNTISGDAVAGDKIAGDKIVNHYGSEKKS
ncbi:hypothetical protein [Bathymodiolus thermophilus thioautotrophic gill symbiont]|uniref:Uncharacterized protein n=1 Tax=Bathymodiolus thermophilus thioautotrophic gill symbiont TaxID=2360 RepID=A0A1J5UK70_9GAMM|nr:hypothetical protein [Bathymodiolus thermophilus thioautotrophic gill symbiont]OIR24655.1 hypothetical protein BGC33_04130 [Bathymodiolus thermophilus thioautotrophic gill symbiont]